MIKNFQLFIFIVNFDTIFGESLNNGNLSQNTPFKDKVRFL